MKDDYWIGIRKGEELEYMEKDFGENVFMNEKDALRKVMENKDMGIIKSPSILTKCIQ